VKPPTFDKTNNKNKEEEEGSAKQRRPRTFILVYSNCGKMAHPSSPYNPIMTKRWVGSIVVNRYYFIPLKMMTCTIGCIINYMHVGHHCQRQQQLQQQSSSQSSSGTFFSSSAHTLRKSKGSQTLPFKKLLYSLWMRRRACIFFLNNQIGMLFGCHGWTYYYYHHKQTLAVDPIILTTIESQSRQMRMLQWKRGRARRLVQYPI
jgi:hypothetical protein